jgi:hypothetical protein
MPTWKGTTGRGGALCDYGRRWRPLRPAHSIDVAWLRRRGMLKPGGHSVTWSRGGEPSGSISVVPEPTGVRLLYWLKDANGARISVDELVPFRYTATRFGGRRRWLTCLKCARRCRRIFGGRYFRCRQCYGLVYASTRETPHQRAINRADRLRKRVGGGRGAFDGEAFPPKPPRMRWRTYRRLGLSRGTGVQADGALSYRDGSLRRGSKREKRTIARWWAYRSDAELWTDLISRADCAVCPTGRAHGTGALPPTESDSCLRS